MKALFDQFVTRVNAEYNVEKEKGTKRVCRLTIYFMSEDLGQKSVSYYLLHVIFDFDC